MERGALLIMRRALLVFLLCVTWAQTLGGSQSVVLVVGPASSVMDLDPVTVRKLFLGLPVLINGHPLHPVRNRSDQRFDPIFLQQIVAMTQAAYDRQILIGVNRQGWLRPTELVSRAHVLEVLYSDPNAVTFMWLRDAEHDPKIRVIRVLWTD
jgi:hypothetical protein